MGGFVTAFVLLAIAVVCLIASLCATIIGPVAIWDAEYVWNRTERMLPGDYFMYQSEVLEGARDDPSIMVYADVDNKIIAYVYDRENVPPLTETSVTSSWFSQDLHSGDYVFAPFFMTPSESCSFTYNLNSEATVYVFAKSAYENYKKTRTASDYEARLTNAKQGIYNFTPKPEGRQAYYLVIEAGASDIYIYDAKLNVNVTHLQHNGGGMGLFSRNESIYVREDEVLIIEFEYTYDRGEENPVTVLFYTQQLKKMGITGILHLAIGLVFTVASLIFTIVMILSLRRKFRERDEPVMYEKDVQVTQFA